MNIIPLLDKFCNDKHGEYPSYTHLINADLQDMHLDTYIGFFCIIDFYWIAQ